MRSMFGLGVFASVGMVLVAIGVFSVIAYIVSRQTHEIGIRIALGATSPAVFRMVLTVGLRLIGIGACHLMTLSPSAASWRSSPSLASPPATFPRAGPHGWIPWWHCAMNSPDPV
jgi:hypothetical protein